MFCGRLRLTILQVFIAMSAAGLVPVLVGVPDSALAQGASGRRDGNRSGAAADSAARRPADKTDVLDLADRSEAPQRTPAPAPAVAAAGENVVVCEAGCDGPSGSVVYRGPRVAVDSAPAASALLQRVSAPLGSPIRPLVAGRDSKATDPAMADVALAGPDDAIVCVAGCYDETPRRAPVQLQQRGINALALPAARDKTAPAIAADAPVVASRRARSAARKVQRATRAAARVMPTAEPARAAAVKFKAETPAALRRGYDVDTPPADARATHRQRKTARRSAPRSIAKVSTSWMRQLNQRQVN